MAKHRRSKYIKVPKHKDASHNRISELMYTAGQRKSWAAYFKNKGKHHEAEVSEQKYEAAIKALKTLGIQYK